MNQSLPRQLNIGHKAVFSTPACKAQNTAMLAVLRGFETQQDGVLDGATVQAMTPNSTDFVAATATAITTMKGQPCE
jgi:hypothetical protein